MIAWSIKAAKRAQCFDQIVVSTDDQEVAEVAKAWGATAPFLRPAELADDFSGTTPVVAHAVQWYQNQGQELDAVCCLYATAPFVEAAEIRQGLELLSQVALDRFVFTATTYASPIQRALWFDMAAGVVHMCDSESFGKRSQDLEPAYHDAGQFYWGRPEGWLKSVNLFEGSKPMLLPRWRVQDIDDEEDWFRAELMRKALFAGSVDE